MKVKCEYCASYINDYDEKCPNCGAPNAHLVRNANAAPKTIEQLKAWYIARNLPDENTTRFFIGKNYQGARAFGIYKDETTDNFVVYKNKGDGSRAIRYEGKDEAYAVNELYMKLKEEIANQKARNLSNTNSSSKNSDKYKSIILAVCIFCIIIFILIFLPAFRGPSRGYYLYDNDYYYYQNGDWYRYDNYSGWSYTAAPQELQDNHSDYESSSSNSISSFEDSDYYVEPSTYDNSWDSSSDWSSSSSWDSGSSDWSSDW